MPNTGGGGRLAWKDRIDKRSWVDSSPWLASPAADDPDSVEFLEVEPSDYRLSETDPAPAERSQPAVGSGGSSAVPKIVAAGAAIVVLIMLVVISRPSDEDPLDQLPTGQQQEIRQRQEERRAAQEEEGAAEVGAAPRPAEDQSEPEPGSDADAELGAEDRVPVGELPPVPELPSGLPTDLSGRLLAAGPAGSVVALTLATGQVDEVEIPAGDQEAGFNSLQQLGPELFVHRGERLLQVTPDGGVEGPTAPIEEILAADRGLTIVVRGEETRAVYILPQPLEGIPAPLEPWRFGDDVRLLGSWQGRILVEKGGTVWLVDQTGNSEEVTTGRYLNYDGRHLTMMRCDGPDACRIESGLPPNPGRRSVPIPDSLADRSLADWTASVAVSFDGERLAFIDNRDGTSVPVWIDMDTGRTNTITDEAQRNSPLAWSPDERYLAYAAGTEIVVWRLEDGLRTGLELLRPISHLLWSSETLDTES